MKNSILKVVSAFFVFCTLFFNPPSSFGLDHHQPALIAHKAAIHPKDYMMSGITTVPQGFVGLLEYLGEYVETIKPGLTWKAPFVYSCIPVDMRSIFVDTPQQRALTKNMQDMIIDGSFTYRIINAYEAVYNIQDLEDSITALYYQSVLAQIATLNDEQVKDLNKDEFSRVLQDNLNATIRGDIITKKIKGHSKPQKRKEKDEEMPSILETDKLYTPESLSYQGSRVYGATSLTPLDNREKLVKDYEVRQWGVIVEKVTITNIAYPKSILDNMAASRQAEQQQQITNIQAKTAQQKMEIDAQAARTKMEIDAQAQRTKMGIDAEAKLFTMQKQAEAQAIQQEIEANIKLKTADTEAKARETEATGMANAALTKAKLEAEAKFFSVQKQAEGQANQQEIEANMKLKTAQAEAKARETEATGMANAILTKAKAEAEASAMKIRAEAEANALKIKIEAEARAEGQRFEAQVLADHPEYAKIKMGQITADAMTKFYTSENSKVIFGDLGTHENLFTQLLGLQAVIK